MLSWARGLNFVLSLHLHSYLMYASSSRSGEFAHMPICAVSPEPSLLDNAITCIQVKINKRRFIEKNATEDIIRSTRILIQVQVNAPFFLYIWHQ